MARVESRTVLHAPCRTVRSGCRTSQTDIWMSATKTITLHLHPAIVLICRHSQSDDYRERLVEVISCTDYSSHLLFVIGDLPHIPCSSVASLLYYFGTAGRLWWLILCYTWNYQTTNTGSIEKYQVQMQMVAWAAPLGLVMLALMARSISADPLSGICFVGGSSMILDGVFNLFRDFVLVFACSLPLLFGCFTMLNSPQDQFSAGLVGVLYPVAALFYMLSFANDAVQPSMQWSRSWNIVSAIKILIDPILGVIASSCCLMHIVVNSCRSIRSPVGNKHGYQPAVPRIPQPTIPVSIRSHNTYASAQREHLWQNKYKLRNPISQIHMSTNFLQPEKKSLQHQSLESLVLHIQLQPREKKELPGKRIAVVAKRFDLISNLFSLAQYFYQMRC
uniref:Frizzled-4 n=1 Tax=Heterorhabditis bacteriophora TaxID=37862 RepID=A0A1I7WZJ8_HETBA